MSHTMIMNSSKLFENLWQRHNNLRSQTLKIAWVWFYWWISKLELNFVSQIKRQISKSEIALRARCKKKPDDTVKADQFISINDDECRLCAKRHVKRCRVFVSKRTNWSRTAFDEQKEELDFIVNGIRQKRHFSSLIINVRSTHWKLWKLTKIISVR